MRDFLITILTILIIAAWGIFVHLHYEWQERRKNRK